MSSNPLLPLLVAFRVPWSAATGPNFIDVVESDHGKPVSASFTAYFKLLDYFGPSDGTYVKLVPNLPPKFSPTPSGRAEPYKMVRLNFVDGLQYRRVEPFSEDSTLNIDAYDWSGVPAGKFDADRFDEQLLDEQSRWWVAQGVCPDPSAYEVQGSPWLAELGERAVGLKHYLIAIEEDILEVIARDCSWEIGQDVD